MKILLKISVTLILFFLIFRKIEFSQVWAEFINVDILFVILALLMQFFSTFIAAYRWTGIMQALNFGQDYGFYLKNYFKGIFFNQGLPTSIGGDAYRVLVVARLGFRKRDALYGVAIDRIMGLTSLLVLNGIANLFNPNWLPDEIFILINVIILISILSIALLIHLQKSVFFNQRTYLKPMVEMSQRFTFVYGNSKRCLSHLTLSMITHAASIFALYMIGTGMGMNQAFITYLILVPPVVLLTLIPISLAGWGVREGALIGLFLLTGAEKPVILSMSVLYGLVVLTTSLAGLVFYLNDKPRKNKIYSQQCKDNKQD